jgi:hypothetical protein
VLLMDRPPIAVVQRHGSKTILLHPGAGSPRKRWPLPGFMELAARIKARRLNPEFVIGPAEQDLLSELERHGTTVHQPLDLHHLLDLFRSAAAYVGNDSGASHLAAWSGLPSVVIFGPTDPARWRPLGAAVEIVQPPLECVPCFEVEIANCAAENCLAATRPENVLGALERLIWVRPSGSSDRSAFMCCAPPAEISRRNLRRPAIQHALCWPRSCAPFTLRVHLTVDVSSPEHPVRRADMPIWTKRSWR